MVTIPLFYLSRNDGVDIVVGYDLQYNSLPAVIFIAKINYYCPQKSKYVLILILLSTLGYQHWLMLEFFGFLQFGFCTWRRISSRA